MNRWSWTLGAGLVLILAATAGAHAQQRGMMRGQMHADTATSCPGGMGGMGMGMMHGHGMMGGMDRAKGMMRGARGDSAGPTPMRRGGMGMMGARPARLLAQRDELGLTDDQVARLEELGEKQRDMMRGMHTGMTAVRRQMRDVTAPDSLDLDAYRSALEAMADQMVGHRMQWARFQQRVLGVLTPEQREQVEARTKRPGHMMRGAGPGGG